MAIVKNVLKTKLKVFADQLSPLFEGFPANTKENAEKWGDAIDFYASVITPPSTTSTIARQALINILLGLSDPVNEITSPVPFTLYYLSPETRLMRFNKYLTTKTGYISDPVLDRSVVFQKLNRIRETYNKLYPQSALTVDDIYYNQRRFNQIYKTDIDNKRKFKLLPDGTTVDSTGLPYIYKRIPVNPEGVIIPLQEDGIIGDDTIRYGPIVDYIIHENAGSKWNAIYAKLPYIVQPTSAGEIWAGIPKKDEVGNYRINNQKVLSYVFKKEIIDKKLCKDYAKIQIDTTQTELDGVLGYNTSKVSSYINVFETWHSSCDSIWLKNNIKTLNEYLVFLKKDKVLFDAKPVVQKDGMKALENAIMAYAQQLAIGMLPNFTAAPSVAPLSFAPVSSQGLGGASNEVCINSIVDLIHTYFKGGTATNNTSGTTTSWT